MIALTYLYTVTLTDHTVHSTADTTVKERFYA